MPHWECEKCRVGFDTYHEFLDHKKVGHCSVAATDLGSWTCPECKGVGLGHDNWLKHSREHRGMDLHPIVVAELPTPTPASASAFSTQVGGSHYKSYAIQPYEFFFKNNVPHHKAAIIRRIMRYDHPTGKGLEDLLKIKHEIDLIIELHGYKEEEKP